MLSVSHVQRNELSACALTKLSDGLLAIFGRRKHALDGAVRISTLRDKSWHLSPPLEIYFAGCRVVRSNPSHFRLGSFVGVPVAR